MLWSYQCGVVWPQYFSCVDRVKGGVDIDGNHIVERCG